MPLYPIAMHIIAIFERETNWGLFWDGIRVHQSTHSWKFSR